MWSISVLVRSVVLAFPGIIDGGSEKSKDPYIFKLRVKPACWSHNNVYPAAFYFRLAD